MRYHGAGRYAEGGEEELSTLVLIQDKCLRPFIRGDSDHGFAGFTVKYLSIFMCLISLGPYSLWPRTATPCSARSKSAVSLPLRSRRVSWIISRMKMRHPWHFSTMQNDDLAVVAFCIPAMRSLTWFDSYGVYSTIYSTRRRVHS